MKLFFLSAGAMLAVLAAPSQARVVCTAISDGESGRVLSQQGDCATRVTPASTFKIALAAMGYDAGVLKSEHEPSWPYRPGYVDWGGDNWKQNTDPTRWLKYSVVWYSQQIAQRLGEQKLSDYARSFGYGNADFSGDPGKRNGLERAWIGSSLKVSPLEQVAFLNKLLNDKLPVSKEAQRLTRAIVETSALPGGGSAHGKTGMAYPRLDNGEQDLTHPYGWFVGWTEQDGRKLVFARLIQDDRKESGTAGVRAREAFLRELPGIAASLPR
ncbi:class D beta-lactamase [Chromobacterium sp. IIBBL 290-4]|uniref:class D beta-lactamase n=1 Tax=Chromobacterium sp. IIBBL 290-4 TaxID=2953890 RepID=UPI0020B6BC36|nr:class D beta-lactamase [Chromobacterium sp. IIBBL 290-4]UTH76309.1 class D beta-lactamase [Chromobacterium sp. IIBBL 290-4]